MPKVVKTSDLPAAAAGVAEAAAVDVDDVEVPPLPPIDITDDKDEGAKKPPAAAKKNAAVVREQQEQQTNPKFYAVRVGYAVHSSDKADGEGGSSSSSHVSTIRSAIFLRWEDVQPFVEFQEDDIPPEAAAFLQLEKIQYKEFNDIESALHYLQGVDTPGAAITGKTKIRSLKKPDIMPLVPPAKNFNPPTKKWEGMYNAALQYKSTHGNLDITSADTDTLTEDEKELLKWVKYQRAQYRTYLDDPMGRNHSVTAEKVIRLKEAGFEWIVEDKKKWLTDQMSPRKRGRPRKSESPEKKSKKQKKKRDSSVEVKNRPIRQKWLDMLESLRAYKTAHGTIEIPDDDNSEENKELKTWVKAQKYNYIRWNAGHDVGMTQEKANMLIELGMDFVPSWDQMFGKVVEYKEQHGHINVTPEEDGDLSKWMQKQNHVLGKHLSGSTTRLKKDQIARLLNVGFQGGRTKFVSGDYVEKGPKGGADSFDARWDVMFEQLQEYKNENGNCDVPTSEGSDLSNWVAAQRRMYGKLISGKPGKRSFLDASKMQRLTDIGFQFRPRGSYFSWEEQMAELRKFKEENGHCKVPVNHERLGSFTKLVRREYKKYQKGTKCAMNAQKVEELQELGFVFEGGKTPERKVTTPKTWEERYADLIQYKKEMGDTVVPQNSGRLGQWVHAQRVHYKKFKRGEKSQMNAERALKLSEIGFVFDAGDRFRGSNKMGGQPSQEEVAQVSEALNPPPLGGSFF